MSKQDTCPTIPQRPTKGPTWCDHAKKAKRGATGRMKRDPKEDLPGEEPRQRAEHNKTDARLCRKADLTPWCVSGQRLAKDQRRP
jgi:hypothetical protein